MSILGSIFRKQNVPERNTLNSYIIARRIRVRKYTTGKCLYFYFVILSLAR